MERGGYRGSTKGFKFPTEELFIGNDGDFMGLLIKRPIKVYFLFLFFFQTTQ